MVEIKRSECPECKTFRGPWVETCEKCGLSFKEHDALKAKEGEERTKKEQDEKALAKGCPSCGVPHETGAETCPKCGTVFTKWPGLLFYFGAVGQKDLLWSTQLLEWLSRFEIVQYRVLRFRKP